MWTGEGGGVKGFVLSRVRIALLTLAEGGAFGLFVGALEGITGGESHGALLRWLEEEEDWDKAERECVLRKLKISHREGLRSVK